MLSIGKVLYKGLPHVLAHSSLPVKSHPHLIDKQIDSADLRDSPQVRAVGAYCRAWSVSLSLLSTLVLISLVNTS